jgi:hypothetical protein
MVEFTYIAIGRRKGYENPQPAAEVIDENYLDKLSVGLHNDNDRQNPGLKLSYKNGQLVTEKLNPPETFEPKTEINHPETGIPTGSRR